MKPTDPNLREMRIELHAADCPCLEPVPAKTLILGIDPGLLGGGGQDDSPGLELEGTADFLGAYFEVMYEWQSFSLGLCEADIQVIPAYYGYRASGDPEAHLVKATLEPSGQHTPKWRWVAELRCLCHLLGIPYGVLHVYHAPDAPGQGEPPILLAYSYEFSQKDREATWKTVVEAREHYRFPTYRSKLKENTQP